VILTRELVGDFARELTALHDLAPDAAIFDLGQVDPAAPFELAGEAHVVSILPTTRKSASPFFEELRN
jgi:hypothetical protein